MRLSNEVMMAALFFGAVYGELTIYHRPVEEGLVAVRVWRRWERNVNDSLPCEDRETFSRFGVMPILPVIGLRPEIANVIEKQVAYVREVISSTRNSV